MAGSVPEYYFAKPRLEHVGVTTADDDKRPLSWSPFPQSTNEAFIVGYCALPFSWLMSFMSMNKAGPYGRPPPIIHPGNLYKYALYYVGALAFARWTQRAVVKTVSYEDRVVDEYMRLYPEKFPEYKPRKLVNTFSKWYPSRSGSADTRTDTFAKFRKPETVHYVPTNDENPA